MQPSQQLPSQVQQSNELAAISLASRIPSFWTDMPRMWFVQFEAIVGPQHQSENIKYDLVLSKLGREELSQIADFIDDPPESQRYTMLKNRLLKIFQESAEAQFHKLVKEMDLGQQRPSQLLSKMRELAKNTGTANDTLKNLWLARLPGWVRAILAISNAETKLDELAGMADKIMDNLRSGEVAAVDAPSTSVQDQHVNVELLSHLRNMALEIKALRGEVNSIRGRQMYRNFYRWSRNRSRSASAGRRRPGRSPHGSTRSPHRSDRLCWYHHKFQAEARKCQSPCAWKPNPEN